MNIEIIKPYRLENFLSNSENKRIFITGGSGSGKSTLWNSLEEKLGNTLAFPTRFTSRPVRSDDNIKENQHLNFNDFNPLFKEKIIEFFWQKFLPNGTEYYGFKFTDKKCKIYSCNNEFLLNSNFLKTHSDLFENGLIVHVKTDIEIRKSRLLERYKKQNITESELLYRLTSNEDKIIDKYDITINNNEDILTARSNLIDILSLNSL